MAIQHIFDDASRMMTVVSFVTFMGIVAWTYLLRKEKDFAATAALPFADDMADEAADDVEDDYV
jgi:cytochrome c oxidase cbb3-type subunit 4